jgi:hypothetical protein
MDTHLVGLRARRLRLAALTMCLALPLGAGCVERTVSINTDPEGATVMLNDQEVGKTPLKVPFTWYGDYDVIVRKEGYQTVRTHEKINAPWYEMPGIDLFSECFVPYTVHDDRELATIVMEPSQYPTKDALLKDAAEMKERALAAEAKE